MNDAAGVSPRPRILITQHARARAKQRFSGAIAAHLEEMAENARRTGAQTKDGLWAYKHNATGVVFLMLEKEAVSMGGLYELEAITVITSDMLEKLRSS